ncbi:hypothetical protein BDV95DRAFT_593680 [Massariosphaeria phaeospora]|uniref:Uncharacterized protein n=1 Tax=Massariosphaeria phaeospora TaxID=100035 RepID=A0A7C8MB70_9PLEO|nr:hypothetical protein BDV95DRAFT_593680 [Massariosphaeria phaeospora]
MRVAHNPRHLDCGISGAAPLEIHGFFPWAMGGFRPRPCRTLPKDLPELSALARPLDAIFFQGLLASHTVYNWETESNLNLKVYGVTSLLRGGGAKIVAKIRLYPKTLYLDCADGNTDGLAHHILSILLHEQIHAYSKLYLCFVSGRSLNITENGGDGMRVPVMGLRLLHWPELFTKRQTLS